MKAVVFDFAGTLFDDTRVVTPARLAAACAARGKRLSAAEAADLHARIFRAVDSPEGREARAGADLSEAAHARAFTGLAEAAVGDATVAAAFYGCVVAVEAWKPYPDVPGLLRALDAGGVPVGVVSNTGWNIRGSFRLAELAPFVRRYVLSCETGLVKPQPEIFTLACAELGVPADQTLMVGDDPRTDGGAAAAGMPVYLLRTARAPGRPRGLAPIARLFGLDVA